MSEGRRHKSTAPALGLLGATLAILLTLVAAGLLWLAGGDDSPALTKTTIEPARIVSVVQLREEARESAAPIYWAGSPGARRLELSRGADGTVYLRYLAPGVEAGDPRAYFLTVGTYPVADAEAAVRRAAATTPGARVGHAAGGIVLINPGEPLSTYLAYPGADQQLEVYDPTPGRALELIRAGAVRPVG